MSSYVAGLKWRRPVPDRAIFRMKFTRTGGRTRGREVAAGLELRRPGPQSMRRLFTFWLVVQIMLPFTAPFPVCDLGDLLSRAPHHSAPLTSNTPDARTDASYSYAPPL